MTAKAKTANSITSVTYYVYVLKILSWSG